MPKITELDFTTTVASDDLVVVARDPNGSPSTNKMTIAGFANSIVTYLPAASNTTLGTIKAGDNLTVNSTGFLNSTTSSLPATSILGPFANDSAANAGGVGVKGIYYDGSGNLKIRLS